jgi:hypothetical protein
MAFGSLSQAQSPAVLKKNNGSSNVGFVQAGGSAVDRTVQEKVREVVSVKDFGATGDGTTDDSAAIQAAIDYAATTVITLDAPSGNVICTARVKIPPGNYRIATALELKNGVRIKGDATFSTIISVDGAINGFYSQSGSTYNSVSVENLTIRNQSGTALTGFLLYGMIRNCSIRDVNVWQFTDGIKIHDTWTLILKDLLVSSSSNHSVWVSSGCGEIIIDGGRYDVCTDHIIYVDNLSTVAELTMHGVAAQFGSKSSVYVDGGCRSVNITDCFFEGSCIGNPAHYYVELYGTNATYSNCKVSKCVINDLADSNRRGNGAILIDDFYHVEYDERWVRNGAQALPIIGSNVVNVDLKSINTSADFSATELTHIGASQAKHAKVSQLSRPYQYYGQDINDTGSFSLTRGTIGIYGENPDGNGAVYGCYDGDPCVQANSKYLINPAQGDVEIAYTSDSVTFLGGMAYRVQATSSNFTTDASSSVVIVNTSAGNRGVTIAAATERTNRVLIIKKNDGGANTLTITPNSGNIDGAATLVLSAAYDKATIIFDGSNWHTI